MKITHTPLLIYSLLFLSTISLTAADLKVFLLGGQSNMSGLGITNDLPTSPINYQLPQNNIPFFYADYEQNIQPLTTLRPGSGWQNAVGCEVSFGRTIALLDPSSNYAIIKHAEAATALYNDWSPNTNLSYSRFRNTVTQGIAALQAAGHTVEIVGMLWIQGESDALEAQQDNYQANFTAFLADIRIRYGANLPILTAEINRTTAALITVNNAQIAVANNDPLTTFIPTADLTFRDAYHFDTPALITIGERFANTFHNLNSTTPGNDLPITGVSIADHSSQFNTNRPATNLIDGTGFNETTGTHINSDTGLWNNTGEGIFPSNISDPLPIHVTFDLGNNYNLKSTKIWNWNDAGTLNAGANHIQIFSSQGPNSPFTSIGNFILNKAPGNNTTDFGQTIDLAGNPSQNVRLIRIEITSNHGFSFSLAGLSEVRFYKTTSINNYASYISNPIFNLPTNQQGSSDDPDKDNLPNAIEAWLGTNPNTFTQSPILSKQSNNNQWTLIHPTNSNPPIDLTATYQWSPDLINWFDNGTAPTNSTPTTFTTTTNSGNTDVSITTGNNNNLFFRIKVSQN